MITINYGYCKGAMVCSWFLKYKERSGLGLVIQIPNERGQFIVLICTEIT